jgi:formylmethanofuran dehydrogenase subunit C
MSDVVTLSLRSELGEPVEVEHLTADHLASLSEQEIASLPVYAGARIAKVGDFFDVRGEHSARVRIEGDVTQVDGLGAGTAGGELLIDGNAGRRVAAKMTGGWVDVRGNAGDDAGLAMAGGALRVLGNAGDRVGGPTPGAAKGMLGGEILINGSAGVEAAARVRRGLIVIAGNAGDYAARDIIAGTLVVFGRIGAGPGRGSKRGSIVACGGIDVPATYRYACTFRPPHVRLTMTYLRRRYGLSIDQRALDGRYRRYCGDAGDPGRGEILERVTD